eukprot:gene10298-2443_t
MADGGACHMVCVAADGSAPDAKIQEIKRKNEVILKRFQAAEEEAKEQRELDKLAADLERQHIREKRASQRRKQHEARERKQMEEYEAKRRQNIEKEKEFQTQLSKYEEQRELKRKEPVINQSLRSRQNAERPNGPSRRAHAQRKGGMISAKVFMHDLTTNPDCKQLFQIVKDHLQLLRPERKWKEDRERIDAERRARQMQVDENGNAVWVRAWDQPGHKVSLDEKKVAE